MRHLCRRVATLGRMEQASIYVLIDPRTNEIRYVGQTSGPLVKRLRRHIIDTSDESHRSHWIRKLKRQGYIPRIELIQVVPISHWTEAEMYWIAHYRSIGCSLVNGTNGGEGGLGRIVSIAQRAEVSRVHKGKSISQEHRAIVGAAAKARWAKWRAEGQTYSEETIGRMSQAAKDRWVALGPLSPELREAFGRPHRGKPKSPEHRAKIAAGNRKPKTPEHRAKMAEASRSRAKQARLAREAAAMETLF